MIFQDNGHLLPGIHEMEMQVFEDVFGYNSHRMQLIAGFKLGVSHLKICGCKNIYVDGSFVTKKELPEDFDACWDENGVDLNRLKNDFSTIIDFREHRKYQKLKYKGEFFPMRINASPYDIYLNFFQKDRNGLSKGIIKIKII
jgi:hypothetical protein